MSYICTETRISGPRLGHAWRDEHGSLYATVRLGGATVTFESAADARAVAAACTEAAEALDRLLEGVEDRPDDRGIVPT